MILSYKVVGTFNRRSSVLLTLDVLVFIGFLSWIELFFFGTDLTSVFWLTFVDINGVFDLDLLTADDNDPANCVDCFDVNKIVCRKAGLIIS